MKTKRARLLTIALFLLPFVLTVASLSIGRYHIPLKDIGETVIRAVSPASGRTEPSVQSDILFRIRLPRLLLALMAGAALSVSGASLQALFKNPLVNEYILGISFGAAFGAAVSMVFLGKSFPPQIAAFLFALGAVLAVLLIAGRAESHTVSLLLTGVIVSAFFQALLSLVEFFANPYALQALLFWLMGSLASATWKDLAISLPVMAAGIAVLILMRWRLNVLSLGEEEARAMGVSVRRDKILVILLASMITAAATAVAGVIGWIGLIVPHLVRMVVGADNRKVIPLSAAVGASVLIVADDITRVAATFEIPIGILTSIIGIPFFIFLLRRSRKVWL
ncbi:MAG: FecCD family ABC transporter permease [Candidatus Aminicenantales bacterium]